MELFKYHKNSKQTYKLKTYKPSVVDSSDTNEFNRNKGCQNNIKISNS